MEDERRLIYLLPLLFQSMESVTILSTPLVVAAHESHLLQEVVADLQHGIVMGSMAEPMISVVPSLMPHVLLMELVTIAFSTLVPLEHQHQILQDHVAVALLGLVLVLDEEPIILVVTRQMHLVLILVILRFRLVMEYDALLYILQRV
jgi:hypothetical protein